MAKFLMKQIKSDQRADWIESAVATFGLSDNSLEQIAATLPGKDDEASRWLIEILVANLAAYPYRSDAGFDARLNRVRSALSKLDPSRRLFDNNIHSGRIFRRIGIMFEKFVYDPNLLAKNNYLLNSHGRMLSELMSSPQIGPRLVLSPYVVRVLHQIKPLKPLLYTAATLAIGQYGADDPDFHFWSSIIIAMTDVAMPEMKAQLADVLDEQLLEISKNPQSISQWSVYSHGDLISYTKLSRSELSFLEQLTRFTIGRYRAVLRGDSGDRPASKVIEMLVMRNNLNFPLNANGRAAVDAIRDATAGPAVEFEQLLTEATRKATERIAAAGGATRSLPDQFVMVFSREDKNLVEVNYDWNRQGSGGGDAVRLGGWSGGTGGLGLLGGGTVDSANIDLSFTIDSEMAMSVLLHEQTKLMPQLESDNK